MQIHKIFRVSVVVGAVSYAAYWFLPYSYAFLSQETGALLSYAGHGAVYRGNEILDLMLFSAWMISAMGMFMFRKVARIAFVYLLVLNTLAVPFYGLAVETAGGAMLLDVAHIASGIVIALAYFSPLKDRFH